MTMPARLADWLGLLESRHAQSIQLGLERVARVWRAMQTPVQVPVLTVGGTNGKGSTCAYLEAMLTAAGYRVGLYTSPHLLRYNERVRIAGVEATDAAIVASLAAVEEARGEVPLTYFEHATLAALWLFARESVEVLVLEVGLGGRLDAVNLLDADCAMVTSVDLDHQDYLGDDRESIGLEKAGIYRSGRPALCGEPRPPASLLAHAEAIGAPILCLGRDYRVEMGEGGWHCRVADSLYPALPRPVMPGEHQLHNAATAIAALWSVRQRLPVSIQAIRAGLVAARQPGRFQVIGLSPLRVLDVAHNPHAARALAASLAQLPAGGRVRAVFAMLRDKDVEGVLDALAGQVHVWYLAPTVGPRGLPVEALAAHLRARGLAAQCHPDVVAAWRAACQEAGPADTIAAFGSFYTVADILSLHRNDG